MKNIKRKTILVGMLSMVFCSLSIITVAEAKKSRSPSKIIGLGEFSYDRTECDYSVNYRKIKGQKNAQIRVFFEDGDREGDWCEFKNHYLNIPGLTYNSNDKNFYYEDSNGDIYQCTYRKNFLLIKAHRDKDCKIEVIRNRGKKRQDDSLQINLLLFK
jgi:hypothetical protein